MLLPEIETDREVLQAKIAKASEKLYQVAKSAYGPKAGNVMLGFKHGAPMLSRDGVTNLRHVRLEDPLEDDAAQVIWQVSEQNNKKVGDGTTAVVILTHHLLQAARKLEGKGYNPMEVSAKLKQAEEIALAHIDKTKSPLGKDLHLEDIATIASGDPELGAMIAAILTEVGADGGVLIEPYEGLGVHNEIIDGFYFGKGYKDTDLINNPSENQSDFHDVPILVSNKTFDTQLDLGPVLEQILKAGFQRLAIIGEVGGEALQLLKLSKSKGILIATPVDPPYFAGGRSLFLDDVALMVGCEVYNGVDFDPAKHLGTAKEVLINTYSTTILGGDSDGENLQLRVDELRKQVAEEVNPNDIQFAKDRLARLTGKMAIIRVGGAIEFERDEVKLRVQDAVCAVQSAMKDGILPGGGTTLARIKGTEFDDAFKQPFKQLMENAGLNPSDYLAKLENALPWQGFNLKNLSEQPVDLLKEGVLDPTLVIKEVIINACSAARNLITASSAISYREKE